MVEGLSHILSHAKTIRGNRALQISHTLNISHFLFVDDILVLCEGSKRDLEMLDQGLNLLMTRAGKVVNKDKTLIVMAQIDP